MIIALAINWSFLNDLNVNNYTEIILQLVCMSRQANLCNCWLTSHIWIWGDGLIRWGYFGFTIWLVWIIYKLSDFLFSIFIDAIISSSKMTDHIMILNRVSFEVSIRLMSDAFQYLCLFLSPCTIVIVIPFRRNFNHQPKRCATYHITSHIRFFFRLFAT